MQENHYQRSLHQRLIQAVRAWPDRHDADTRRRAWTVQIIALGLVGLALALLISTLIRGTADHTVAILICGATIFGASGLLAAAGRAQLAAGLLITVVLVATLASVADSDQLRSAPYFVSLSLLIAGMTLRPRGVGVTLVGALITLAAVSALGTRVVQTPLPAGSLIVNATLLTGIVTLLATLAARGAAHAERTVQAREQEAHRAEQALHESEERYNLIAEHSSDLIALIDANGHYLYASPSHTRALGVAPRTLIGAQRPDLIHPEDVVIPANLWDQVQAHGSAQASYRVARRDGSWRWIETQLTAVTRQTEQYFVLVGRDITERRTLEAQLQQARKLEALGRLAGVVAHDFSTLLTVINSSIEQAAIALPTEHRARPDLATAQAAGQRAATLTRQLLAFARREVIRQRSVNLTDIVHDLSPLVQRLIGGNIRLITEAAPDVCATIADPAQIEQLIMNLAANARDAMPDGGTLTIIVANAADEAGPARERIAPRMPAVCLTVADTGSGMSDEVQHHLFEPFFTTKAPGYGTGLGLAICYGIVTQSGGTISVSSRPGRGTTVTIWLPCADAHDGETPWTRALN
jgi:PAS domain S-box-containing protein